MNIWNDDDASTAEKVLTTFETMATVAPMLALGYKGVVEGSKKLTQATLGEIIAGKTAAKTKEEVAIATEADAVAKETDTGATTAASTATSI